ncbi:MAG: hypothetical protein MAGBODY4_00279 [Candidatus Marinimicrobia bacterium]|nr:hypothetical protein [Candidatus Neomarinimicrobiota bacterium]
MPALGQSFGNANALFPIHQRRRPVDIEIVNIVSILPSDFDDILETFSRQQPDVSTIPFQNGIRGDGRSMNDRGKIMRDPLHLLLNYL